ncbi:MAG: HAD hydrolase family protein [Clostridia bacterium]|nr:HAD hydrolase family protein [Clostridia bacterium]
MSGVRMAVFDLDGTLLEHGALTKEAVGMLRTLRKNGVQVVIATGRHRGTVPLRLQSPRLVDYMICSNGAVLTEPRKKPLLETTLSARELRSLLELGRGFGCRYAVSVGRVTYLSRREPLQRRKTDGGSDTKKYFWRYCMYPLHSRLVKSWDAFLRRPDARAEKVVCTTADPKQELIFRALAEKSGPFTATGSGQAAEITAAGVSKGSALGLLTARLNIPKEAVAAFGNDDNDLSLRPYAGRFVAAKNATAAALEAADEVADSIPAAALRLCVSSERKEANHPW